MKPVSAARLTALSLAVVLLAACGRPTTPRVEGPLAIEVEELCTRCIEVFRCEGGGRRAVYVMHEKSTWAQIATIWDYLVQFIRPKTADARDLTHYELGEPDGASVARSSGLRARLDVWNRRIELPDSVIEQRSGAWHTRDGRALGACKHVPRREDRALARRLPMTPHDP